jgi:hypothetical protein
VLCEDGVPRELARMKISLDLPWLGMVPEIPSVLGEDDPLMDQAGYRELPSFSRAPWSTA